MKAAPEYFQPSKTLWRAGLSNRRTARVGLRSSPKTIN